MPSIKVDSETHRLLLKLKYELALKGQHVSFGELVKKAVFEHYKSEKVSTNTSIKVEESQDVKVQKYESEKESEVDARKEIEEAVQSVDVQKKRFKHVEVHRMGREALEEQKNEQVEVKKFWEILTRFVKVVSEKRICGCGGEIVRTLALKSFSNTTGKDVIHRVLAVCTSCGEKYLMKLYPVRSIEEVKLKDRVMDWKDFQKTVVEINGVKEEWFKIV